MAHQTGFFSKKYRNTSFLKQIKPVIVALCLLGRFPFVITNTGQLQIKLISFSSLYCILMHSFQTYLNVLNVNHLIHIITHEDVDFVAMVHGLICLLITSFNFYVPLAIIFENPKVVTYINEWNNFQDLYFRTTCMEYSFGSIFTSIIGVIAAFLFSLWLVIHTILFHYDHQYQLIGYFTTLAAGMVIEVFWLVCQGELRRAGEDLKNKIDHAFNKRSVNFHKSEIAKLRKLWLFLSELVRFSGDALAISTVVYLLLCGSTFVAASYAFLSNIWTEQWQNYFLVMTVSGVLIIYICDSSHRTTRKVGDDILWVLINLDVETMHPSRASEVILFINTIKYKYPVINLNGISIINRATLVKIAASILTYLVVLVQLQSISPTNR